MLVDDNQKMQKYPTGGCTPKTKAPQKPHGQIS